MLYYFRYALRGLRKTPLFTAAVVLTLALGIGANSAVFSAIDAVLLRPLGFPDAGRLVQLAQYNPKSPQQPFVAPVRLEDWNRLNTTFQAISGSYAQDDSELSGQLPEKLSHAFVAPRFLQVWGIAPELGRDFSEQEEHFNGPPAVLISDRFWRRRFAADPHVLGRTLRLGMRAIPIVGVMPPSFTVPDREVDLWSPSPPDGPFPKPRELTWFTVFGRMKPGVTLAQARADLARVQANLGRAYPATDAKLAVSVEPLKELTVGGVRSSLWILFGSVTLLLLIACSNIAALLLSRAAGRRQEIALRFSLGASRSAVSAQLIAEVLILAVAGAGLGLLLAGAASRIFKYLAGDLPRVEEIGLDWRVVLYAMVCAVGVTFLCGVFPALRSTRRNLAASLAQAGRSHVSQQNPGQMLLVGVQVALAVTLLSGAGLLARSFQALGRVSPGFDPEHVLTFHMTSSWAETGSGPGSKWADRVAEGLRAIPGVEAASTSLWLPGVPGQFQSELKLVEGDAAPEQKMLAEGRVVSPEYFATVRIPLLAGELCRDDGPATMMVNRSFAASYLGGSKAIGHHLIQAGNAWAPPTAIRGIVADARESGLDTEPGPTVYWCSGAAQPGTYFLVRTHGSPAAIADAIRRKAHEIQPQRSVYGLAPLAEHISGAYGQNRMRAVLLAFFALTAILLCSVGLYGTLSYLVHVRRREVGLRLALGAMRAQIVRQFLWRGVRVCLAGTFAGLALAAWLARLISGVLYGVSPWDGVTLAAVVAVVLVLSVAASVAPALRAARVDPAKMLQHE